MAGRIGRLLAFLRQAGPRSVPSGWALTLDATVAVGAAAAAVAEVAVRAGELLTVLPGGGVAVTTVHTHAPAAVLAGAALTGLPLAARRIFPITVWLVIVAAAVALQSAEVPPVAFGTAVLAAYSAVAHSRYRNLAVGVVLVVTLGITATFANTLPRFPGRLSALFAIIPALAAGLGLRELRRRLRDSAARLSDSAQRLQRAQAGHEAATRRAIAAERSRIAAELHDVVTHNVSVMVVQAGAARTVLASSPDDAAEALLAVEASGRTALAELRNLLGLLSPPGDGTAGDGAATELRPQPGLGELDALVARVTAAGLPVDLRVTGTPRALPPGADLAAYRVAQEGLTNVLRHADRAAASVLVQWGEKLVITVTDDGRGAATGGAAGGGPAGAVSRDGTDGAPMRGAAAGGGVAAGASPASVVDPGGADGGPGRGLLGLRERLSLYGGELDAGPRAGGGWQVRAVMPVGQGPGG
ncbi:MAG TPA: histidine kinase [Streptosporangiaceae bacterium]|nr:histidine kinase [Streptosporangiaceae bacterium]